MQDRDLGQNISPKKHRPFPLVIPPALAAVALTASALSPLRSPMEQSRLQSWISIKPRNID